MHDAAEAGVAGDGIVVEPTLHHLPQPPAGPGQRAMPPLSQFCFDRSQRGAHTFGDRVAVNREAAVGSGPGAHVCEAREVECFRPPLAAHRFPLRIFQLIGRPSRLPSAGRDEASPSHAWIFPAVPSAPTLVRQGGTHGPSSPSCGPGHSLSSDDWFITGLRPSITARRFAAPGFALGIAPFSAGLAACWALP